MNHYIQRLINKLKTRPTLLAHELNGTPRDLTTWKMGLFWSCNDDENEDPKLMEEVLLAAEQEAEAEWACNLLSRASRCCISVTKLDFTGGNAEIYQRRIDEAVRAQVQDFQNPILIVSPTLLTVLGDSEMFFRNDRGMMHDGRIVKFVGYYRNIPVHVNQYAGDREINLICEKGWFIAETDYGIRARAPTVSPHTFEEIVGFETDVKFTVDPNKVRGITIEWGHMLGFI